MEEEKSRKCVVRDKIYDFYYQAEGSYVSSLYDAILEYSKIPEQIKKISDWK